MADPLVLDQVACAALVEQVEEVCTQLLKRVSHFSCHAQKICKVQVQIGLGLV